jgi:phage baseplate assembly protein gpV
MTPNAGQGFTGQAGIADLLTPFNAANFLIWTIVSKIATVSVVQVTKVTNTGGVVAPGFVDVQILVNLIDGAGNATPHKSIHNCPYMRIQGGTNAVIMDPVVGDIGIALFASRDISSVVSNLVANQATPGARPANANPGSRRILDYADGIYLGGILNGVPTQYIEFSATGIKIVSPTAIEFDAPDVKLVAPTLELNATTQITLTAPLVQVNGNLVASGTMQANNGTTDLHTHIHSGVTTGSGQSGPPTA